MQRPPKKRFFANHAKSSAALISLAIHVILIIVSISFVAVTVIKKNEKEFEAKQVKRPQMKLHKLQVPASVKKKKLTPPKMRKPIVAKPTVKTVNIKMPEMMGVAGGTSFADGGDGFGIGFDMPDLFGGNKKSLGFEFAGTFYDLKQSKRGKPTEIDLEGYDQAIKRFLSSWNPNVFADFFKAPTTKYATCFMIPLISANAAPVAFGVDDVVQPEKWLAHYTGTIAAPETGRYRFCGAGDDVLYVRVNKKLVLDGCRQAIQGVLSGWKSDDENDKRYPLGNNKMIFGDWIHMTKGKPVPIEVLIGERPGGSFYCALLIEQDGVTYKQVPYETKEGESSETGMRPVYPVFKMIDVSKELEEKMEIDPNQVTLDGPNFAPVQ